MKQTAPPDVTCILMDRNENERTESGIFYY